MTLDEIKALIDAAAPLPWALGQKMGPNDWALATAAINALPALLEVAQGAKDFSDTWEMKDSSYTPLAKALAALEALKLP